MLERRFEVGEVSRPDLDGAAAEATAAALALRSAEGAVGTTMADMAAALAIPARALDGVALRWPDLEGPPDAAELLKGEMQQDALGNRIEVHRTLEEYAAARAALEGEVRKRIPDVHLGPGVSWDQGDLKFSFGLSIELPLMNRNEGPIAEAVARLHEVEARFLALQARVIAETESALAGYRAAAAELAQARDLDRAFSDREDRLRRAVDAGEEDRLALLDLRVQRSAAARAARCGGEGPGLAGSARGCAGAPARRIVGPARRAGDEPTPECPRNGKVSHPMKPPIATTLAMTLATLLVISCGCGKAETEGNAGGAVAGEEGAKASGAAPAEEEEEKRPAEVSHDDAGNAVVKVSEETRERAGIETAELASSSRSQSLRAFGRILDPAPLVAIQAEAEAVEASMLATRPEAERLRRLSREGDSVARTNLEAAEAQLAVDQSKIDGLHRQVAMAWGDLLGKLDPPARRKLVDRLASGGATIARIDLSPGQELASLPREVRVAPVGKEDAVAVAEAVAEAPSIDPASPGGGLLLVLSGRSLLRAGAPVIAYVELPGEPGSGVIVPRASIVRAGGKDWIYVEVEAEGEKSYTRREVRLEAPSEQGWFVASGGAKGEAELTAGQHVVVVGAASLLSEELLSKGLGGEEE
ncbi:MAG: TolC family protein [Acidobacteriota bacterium]